MAYGARLESVLGESPRGFESPILRRLDALPDALRIGERRPAPVPLVETPPVLGGANRPLSSLMPNGAAPSTGA